MPPHPIAEATLRAMMAQRGYDELHPCPIVQLFLDEAKPSEAHLKSLIELHGDEAATHYLVVVTASQKAAAAVPAALFRYAAAQWKQRRIRIELFHDVELRFPITSHTLVPRHVLLSAEERAALPYPADVLPRLYEFDPVARFFGAQPGDVFRIERPSLFAPSVTQNHAYFRVVIPGHLPIR